MPQSQPSNPEPTSAPPATAELAQLVKGDVVQRDAAIRELLRVSGVPANERQLTGLRARRTELREQLQRASDRRGELHQRLQQEPDADAQRLLRQQLDHATASVLSLEDAITTTDRQVAAAPTELLAATQPAAPTPDLRNVVSEDDAVGAAFGTFGAGVVLTLLVARWRRARRRGAAPAARADAQLQQLGLAVEAIAVEVERIGEGQRFVTQLLADGSAGQPMVRQPRGAAAGSDTTAEAPVRANLAAPSRAAS